ncbi:MAG TPA: glycosyltransferase family 9 protein [Chthoniobacterales bacterium]|jgi:heptosyltransferase-2|nr:glycosyltransferase family 9 protein [Chthoniobacterales bacterium]
MSRILVIRGGAIGDFILTLPALQALRRAHSHAHIEILGYKHIAVLAENRFYAQAVRSIEHGPLASFFAKNSELPAELANYFASFDLIISYLYDPDGVFGMNLRWCGVDNLIHGPGKIERREHAARQLSRPLQTLGLCVDDLASRLYPSTEDRDAANTWLGHCARPIVAFHPGSGGERKNWPLENWIDLGNRLLASEDFRGSIVVISGEADADQAARLESIWKDATLRFAKNLPLPHLAAVLEHTLFVGHDSGISHLAAAAGSNCVLLFGPTDPAVWAPANENVCVLQAPKDEMSRLKFKTVCDALDHALMRIGIRT